MPAKRVLYRREILYVENWRENVLLWLNNHLPRPCYTEAACRRIEQLVFALQNVCDVTVRWRGQRSGRAMLRIPPETATAIDTVVKLIRRYPEWPVLGWDSKGNISFGSDRGPLKRRDEEEAEAAFAVVKLAEVNELTWLRRCLCGTWFFARRKAQKSCSANCRHKLYERTEAFKAKRRRYMRQYYQLQRSGKVK